MVLQNIYFEWLNAFEVINYEMLEVNIMCNVGELNTIWLSIFNVFTLSYIFNFTIQRNKINIISNILSFVNYIFYKGIKTMHSLIQFYQLISYWLFS